MLSQVVDDFRAIVEFLHPGPEDLRNVPLLADYFVPIGALRLVVGAGSVACLLARGLGRRPGRGDVFGRLGLWRGLHSGGSDPEGVGAVDRVRGVHGSTLPGGRFARPPLVTEAHEGEAVL